MLREITTVRQEPGQRSRQWFLDEAMDLFLWKDASGGIEKFQLACKLAGGEFAVTWSREGGLTRHLVDDGEDRCGRHKAAPILIPSREGPFQEVVDSFVRRAMEVRPEIRTFVMSKLVEPSSPPPRKTKEG